MAVDVEGDGDRRVAEPLAHHLRMHAGAEGERRRGVAQVVQAYSGQAALGHGDAEQVGDPIGVDRYAVFAHEHVAGVRP